MLTLPRRIVVQLRDSSGCPLELRDVLIGINLLVDSRYYYGNLIGLTTASGMASIEGTVLTERFEADQARFPMDYKVALQDCDSNVDIMIMTQEDIEQAIGAIVDDFSISPEIRDTYITASNSSVAAANARIDVGVALGREVVVNLTTARTNHREI